MMSMLHDFFDISQDSKPLFEGLAISKNKALCDKWMNQYPAVFITFKGTGEPTYEEALGKMRSRIAEVCKAFKFLIDSTSVDKDDRKKLAALKAEESDNIQLGDSLKTLCRALHEHYGRPDIVVRDKQNKRAAVIEVKRASSEKGLPEAAEKAILQIKENQYAAPLLRKKGWKVSRWGMAFFKKTCILRVENRAELSQKLS